MAGAPEANSAQPGMQIISRATLPDGRALEAKCLLQCRWQGEQAWSSTAHAFGLCKNRMEIVKALSHGVVSRRELVKWA